MVTAADHERRFREISEAMDRAHKMREEVERLLEQSELYEDAMMEALRDRGYQVTENDD